MPLPEPPPLGAAMLPAGTYDGQVVFITGAGTGLGRAMAVEFARLGAALVIASRNAEHRQAGIEAVTRAAEEGRPKPARVIGVSVDVRDPGQVAAAFDEAEAELGPVGVLVNNAAGNFPVPAEDLSFNGWRAVTGIVLDGTFNCSTEFARRAIAREAPGAVLNIGATYAWTGGPGTAHSAAAKAAVTNLDPVAGGRMGAGGNPGELPRARAVPARGPRARDGRSAPNGAAADFTTIPPDGPAACTSSAGPRRTCAPPTRSTSPATHSFSTARTGCGAASGCPSSFRCASSPESTTATGRLITPRPGAAESASRARRTSFLTLPEGVPGQLVDDHDQLGGLLPGHPGRGEVEPWLRRC